LHNPDFLSVCILDSKTRKELGQKIKEHIKETLVPANAKDSINGYISVLKLLASEKRSDLIPNFKAYMNALDALRGEDTLKTFPELKRVLQ
jgi:thermostable 8-oxoguanine DNA glycosylase